MYGVSDQFDCAYDACLLAQLHETNTIRRSAERLERNFHWKDIDSNLRLFERRSKEKKKLHTGMRPVKWIKMTSGFHVIVFFSANKNFYPSKNYFFDWMQSFFQMSKRLKCRFLVMKHNHLEGKKTKDSICIERLASLWLFSARIFARI